MHPIFFEKVNEAMFHFLVSRKKKKKRRITRRVTFWSRSLRINDPGRKIGGQIARELSLAGGIWSSLSPLVLVSRLFGESGGEEDLEKGFYCWRGGLLAFISGSVASQDPALVRRSSVLFASHLAAHFQFDAARAFRGLYSSTISQAYCLYPPFIPEENSWDYLGSRITGRKWPPFEIRSSIRPLSNLLPPLWNPGTSLFLSRFPSRAIINIRGCWMFEMISIFDGQREGERIDRRFWQSSVA